MLLKECMFIKEAGLQSGDRSHAQSKPQIVCWDLPFSAINQGSLMEIQEV